MSPLLPPTPNQWDFDVDISDSQEELIARSPYLTNIVEEAEVFSTPPEQSSQGQGGQQEDAIAMCTLPFTQLSMSSSEEEEDTVTRKEPPRKPRICMRKVRVRGVRIRTPSPSPSPSPERTGRVRGVRIRTPSPSPSPERGVRFRTPSLSPSPSPSPSPERTPSPSPSPERPVEGTGSAAAPQPAVTPPQQPNPSDVEDPLVRAILMMPSAPAPTSSNQNMNILELARQKGIF